MEVKPGYKKTEIGVIPEDWEIIPLSKHVKFIRNGTNSRAALNEYDPVRYLHYGDIHTAQNIYLDPNNDKMPRLPSPAADKLPRLELGDLVFIDASEDVESIGKAVEIVGNGDAEIIAGLHTIAARFDPTIFADGFKAYLQFVPQFSSHLKRLAAGTKVYATSRRHIASAIVPLPKPVEQRVIAQALSDVDASIAVLSQLIAKKRDIRDGAMQRLLTGKTRLPGFTTSWKTRRMGDEIRFQVGFPFRSSFFNRSGMGIRLIRNRDLKSDDDIVFYSGAYDPEYVVRRDDLLVSMDGEFILHLWKSNTALLNQRVGRILKSTNFDIRFLYYYLKAPLRNIEIATAGTTVKHLSHGDIADIEMPFPDSKEQSAIAVILSDMDEEIASLEKRLKKSRALKQAMMQALLTGRIRLPVTCDPTPESRKASHG